MLQNVETNSITQFRGKFIQLTCSVSEISEDLILLRKSRFRLSLFDGGGSRSSSSLNTFTSSEAESVSSDCEAFLLLADDELDGPPVAILPPLEELAKVAADVTLVDVPGILVIHIPNIVHLKYICNQQLFDDKFLKLHVRILVGYSSINAFSVF